MQRDAEQRREQIVDAAYTIVAEGGPSALTAQAVTKAVGVSRPLLYHYFDTMEALLDVVVEHYFEEFSATARAWADEIRRSEADLETAARSAVSTLRPLLVESCPLTGGKPSQVSSTYLGYLGKCAAELDVIAEGSSGTLAQHLEACPLDRSTAISMLVFGLCGTAITRPGLSDQDAAAILVASLAPAEKPSPQPQQAVAETAQPAKTGLFQRIFGR